MTYVICLHLMMEMFLIYLVQKVVIVTPFLGVAVAMTPHQGVICAQNFDTPIWCHHNTLVFTV